MDNTQQQKIARWLLILGLLIVGLIVVSLVIPPQDNSNPEAVISEDPTNTLTPTRTPFTTQEPTQVASPTSTPFPTVTNSAATSLTPIPEKNCTYPVAYWKDHPKVWLAKNILIGNLTYTKEEATTILETNTEDVPTNVLKQLFATILNILKGADPSRIEDTVVIGIDWLSKHSPGDQMSDTEKQTGYRLEDALETYNNGLSGPGLCSDAPRTGIPTPTYTSTPTSTRPPTRAITLAPPASATPTKKPGEGHHKNPPTDTPQPPPTQPPPPPPTQPPPPPPTEPPPPERPTPTLAPP